MSRHRRQQRAAIILRLGLALVLLVGHSWPAAASPDGNAEDTSVLQVPASTHVVAVPDAAHIVVAHGRRDRFPANAKHLLVSPRAEPRPEDATPVVEFGVFIASADVERVDETTTLLRVRDAKQSPKVGDHVTWTLTLPRAAQKLRAEPLFWVAAQDIGAYRADDERPFFELHELLVDATAPSRALDAMVAEVQRYADLADEAYRDRIDSGPYRGRTLREVFAATRVSDISAFWDYVASNPWRYLTHRFRLIEIYATWVVRGAPGADSVAVDHETVALRIALGQRLRRQDWEASEALLTALLRRVPGDAALRDDLTQVGHIRRAGAALARDPMDDSAAWTRGTALADLGHSAAAVLDFERLIVRGYRVDDTKLKLGYSLCAAGRWAECERLFGELVAAHGKRREPDANLEKWLGYARTHGNQGGNSPNADAKAQMATARALESEGGWAMAMASWRNAITLARTAGDARALQAAERGLERARRRANILDSVALGVAALKEHRIADARRVVAAVRQAAQAMEEADAAVLELGAIVEAARAVGEYAFAHEVAQLRVDDVPSSCAGTCKARGAALADLAELVAEGDAALAEPLFAEAVKLAPDNWVVRGKRAWFFAELGRWSDAYGAAFLGSGKSVAMGFTMVRSTAARGKVAEAMEFADRLGRAAPRYGPVAAAAHRLEATQKALLQAGPVGSEATARVVLRRIRALADLGLERVAFGELEALAAFPELQRDAAWAVAKPRTERPIGADLFPLADRARAAEMAIVGGATPERLRVREVLARRLAWRATPNQDNALALARALLVDGDLHEAWGVAQALGGAAGSASDVLARDARVALRAVELTNHAREARQRGDATPQRDLAAEADDVLYRFGIISLSLDARRLRCEALLALGLIQEAYSVGVVGLVRARADGNPAHMRAFEALLVRIIGVDPSGMSDQALSRLALAKAPRVSLHTYEQTLRAHLVQCTTLDDDGCRAHTLEALGLVQIQRGRVTDARVALEEAVAGFEVLCDGAGQRRATMAIARVQRLRSELAQAATTTSRVLDAAIDDGDGDAERAALLELGSLAIAQGDLAASRRWLAAATEAARRGNDALAMARADAGRGRAELLLGGELGVAVDAFDRAMEQFTKLGAMGDALGARVELAEALLLASTGAPPAKKIARPTKQAAAARVLKLVADAPRVAASLGRDVLHARALLALAAARVATRELGLAATALDDARAVAQKTELDDLVARTRYLDAQVALGEGRREDAARIALEAARGIAKSLASGTLPLGRGETQAIFQQAADLLFELGRHEDALELLELQRSASGARTFDLDALRRSANPELASDLSRYADAKARADAITARLREEADTAAGAAQDELVKLAASSQRELAPLAARLEQAHPLHWRALARDPERLAHDSHKLPRGAILVEYFVTTDAVYLFIVRPNGSARAAITALRVAIGAAALDDTVTRYRKLVATDGRLAEPLARELYAWLIAPLANLVPPAERAATTLILLPQGPLLEVPFAALVSSAPSAPVRYAIQDWRLAIASATTLAPLLAGPRKLAVAGPVLGLADPDGNLPDARAELDRLPAQMQSTVLRGADATKAQLLALSPAHRILHFATHGSLAADPRDSSLLLASGRLTVSQIAGLDGLRGKVALVFLSACRTAADAGARSSSEKTPEALSLAEGFALAGVPTLIGSLWDVDDHATRVLVEAFYEALVSHRGDTLEALRTAQLATLTASIGGRTPYAEPRYWSAFQLIGDFR